MKHRYTEALRRAAPHLAQHPIGYNIMREVARFERIGGSEWDEFATGVALHYYCMHHYNGQGDPLYAAMCAIDYTPGRLENENSVCKEGMIGLLYDALTELD